MTRTCIHEVFREYLLKIKQRYVAGTFNAWRSYATELHRYLVQQRGIKWVDLDPDIHDDDYDEVLTTSDLEAYLTWVADYNLGSTASSKFTFVTNFDHTIRLMEKTDRLLTENFELKKFKIEKSESMRRSNKEGVIKPFLPPEEVKLLWEHAPTPHRFRNQTMLKFMWLTGLRRHEVSLTRLDDVEPVPGQPLYKTTVYSNKTDYEKKRRNRVQIDGEWHASWTIYFSDEIGTQLQTYIDIYRPDFSGANDSQYLFLTNKSERMSGNYINEIVKKAADNAGIQSVIGVDAAGRKHHHVTAHTIRHSFATWHANSSQSNLKPIQLCYHMGHDDLSTTQQYIHDDREERMQAFASQKPPL